MKIQTQWNQKMVFTSEADGRRVTMDAKSPIGTSTAMTPKELVAVGLTGCTAMDVAALMKKHRQPVETFEVETDVTMLEGSKPQVFASIDLTLTLTGQVEREKLLESIQLSQTKYCGVSAMLVKAVPIRYRVVLNGEEIGRGQADFT